MDGHVHPVPHGRRSRRRALLAQRLTAKMHRELIAWGWQLARALRPLLQADLGQVLLETSPYPIPSTDKLDGKCFSSHSAVRPCSEGAGKEYPVLGEDFAFMLFHKRNCCVGY